MNYYEENKEQYKKGFKSHLIKLLDDYEEITTEEIKDAFKVYMLEHKNIVIDYRFKLWRNIVNECIKEL